MRKSPIALAGAATMAAAVLALSAFASPAAALSSPNGEQQSVTRTGEVSTTPPPTSTPAPMEAKVNLTYITACAPDATNTWRIRNESDFPVAWTLHYAGRGQVAQGVAQPGDSLVNLDREPATAILKWGGSDSGIIASQKTKASGNDEVCTEPPAPVEAKVNLTYITACAPDTTNTWRIRNDSDVTVDVEWSPAGSSVWTKMSGPKGDTFLETKRGDETMRIRWGGGSTGIVAGEKVKASGKDETCTTPPTQTPTPTPEASLTGSTATGVCLNDAPYIDVKVALTNATPLGGREVRLLLAAGKDAESILVGTTGADGTLEKRVLWPGAKVDGAGNPTAWPGWKQNADGTWVETDENYAWTRTITSATLKVNPDLEVKLNYPPATPNCVAAPPVDVDEELANTGGEKLASTGNSKLASTGVDVAGITAGAALLLGAGVALLVGLRRRAKA